MARHQVERRARVHEAVLAVVDLRKGYEQLRTFVALLVADGLARLHTLEDQRGFFLDELVVLRSIGARRAQHLGGTGEIARGATHSRFIAVQRDLALGLGHQRVLHLEQRQRFGPRLRLLVKLARGVDRELRTRVRLVGSLEVLDRALGLRQRRLRPQRAEFLVHRSNLQRDVGVAPRQRREQLRALLEQRHQPLDVALLAVQLPEPVGREILRRILDHRQQQHFSRVMRVAKRRRPHVRGLAQPVARIRRILRFPSDPFQQGRIGPGISRPSLVCVRKHLLIVGVGNQTLYESLDFARIHVGADATTRRKHAAMNG